MHDGLAFRSAAFLAETAPAPTSDQSVKVAVIGVVGLVLVALIGAWGSTRRFRPSEADESPSSVRRRLTNALLAQREAQHDAALAENAVHDYRRRQAILERFLWRRRFDPVLIVTGEEDDESVRFP